MLLALADGDRHAYGIKKDLAARQAYGNIGPGTLYRTIEQLLASGLIEETDRPVPELDDERRRYYRLTPFGRRVAVAEADRLADLWKAARCAAHRSAVPLMTALRFSETCFRWLMRAIRVSFGGVTGSPVRVVSDDARAQSKGGGLALVDSWARRPGIPLAAHPVHGPGIADQAAGGPNVPDLAATPEWRRQLRRPGCARSFGARRRHGRERAVFNLQRVLLLPLARADRVVRVTAASQRRHNRFLYEFVELRSRTVFAGWPAHAGSVCPCRNGVRQEILAEMFPETT